MSKAKKRRRVHAACLRAVVEDRVAKEPGKKGLALGLADAFFGIFGMRREKRTGGNRR